MLVEQGVDLNAKNEFEETALIWASARGRLEVIDYLEEVINNK